MKKIMIFILALVIVLSAFALSQYDAITDVYADNTKCEDDKTCYWAYHVDKPDQKDQCRHNENDQWRYYQPLRECGGADYKQNTKVPVVVNDPTATKQNNSVQPTATKQNDQVVQPTDSGNDRSKPTVTLTPTYVTGENPQQICDFCSIGETQAAAESTQASAQSTIAAQLSKGE